jgi:hypothetical protein
MSFQLLIDNIETNSINSDSAILGSAVIVGDAEPGPEINSNQLIFSNGSFSSKGDAQTSLFILRGESFDNNLTELYLDGVSAKLVLKNNTSYFFNVKLLGRDNMGNTVAMVVDGAAKRGANATTVSLIGNPHTRLINDEIGVGEMKFEVNIASGSLKFYVVGKNSTNIRWIARVELSELNF